MAAMSEGTSLYVMVCDSASSCVSEALVCLTMCEAGIYRFLLHTLLVKLPAKTCVKTMSSETSELLENGPMHSTHTA